jgi:hypothetical protein
MKLIYWFYSNTDRRTHPCLALASISNCVNGAKKIRLVHSQQKQTFSVAAFSLKCNPDVAFLNYIKNYKTELQTTNWKYMLRFKLSSAI